MTQVVIALGSNINPRANLRRAVRLLGEQCHLLAVSRVYQTAPVGTLDQANFLNAAVLVETGRTAAGLKQHVLSTIEQALGRVRTADKNAPRTIDLDIVLFGEDVLELGARHIPDPDLLKYPHVAVPVADVVPAWRHPETGETMRHIAERLAGGDIRAVDFNINI